MKPRSRSLAGCTLGLLGMAMAPAFAQSTDDETRPDRHHDIEEIVVEAAALERTVEQLAQPTAVLSGDELARKMAPSVGETLSAELGLSSTYFGPVASRPVIRGQFGERVQVLSNGLDSLDASALSEDHQTAVEPILAERVEIIRGPATLLYGSGAAGGLVNVVDNRIVERSYSEPLTGTVALNGDTATGERAGAGWLAFGTGPFTIHLDYFRRDTDEIEVPGFVESRRLRALEEEEEHDDGDGHDEEEEEARGRVENSDSSMDGGAIGVTWIGDDAYLGVSVNTLDSNYGIPGGHGHEHEEDDGAGGVGDPVVEEEEEEEVSIDLEQIRTNIEGRIGLGDGLFEGLRFRAAATNYEHTEFEGDEVGTVFETDGLDTRVELRHRPLGGFEGAFGLQHKRIDFSAVGDEAYVPPSDLRQTSLFLFEELPVTDTLILQGSLRNEWQTIEGTGTGVDYDESATSAAVGAIWAFADEVSAALHFSRTERHPTPTELFAFGPHVAVQRFEIGSVVQGDGILDKETSNNVDLTLRGNTERVDWTFTVFNNDANDYVVLSPLGTEEDELPVFEFQQVDAELYGFEAEARFELLDFSDGHLHARAFSDYVHGEESASGRYLPRLPPLRYGLGLHYTLGDAEFSVEGTQYTKQSKTAANELASDAYLMLDAEFSYSMDDAGLFLFVRGSNLGDEDARQHASPLKDLVPLPGRSLHAGLRFYF